MQKQRCRMNGLKPYQGNEPYLFISYAHADEQAVGSVLENLEEHGVRFWYDDGIEVGSEWPEYIAERLASSEYDDRFRLQCIRGLEQLPQRDALCGLERDQNRQRFSGGRRHHAGNVAADRKYLRADEVPHGRK